MLAERERERRRHIRVVLGEAKGSLHVVIPEKNVLLWERNAQIVDLAEVPDERGALGNRQLVGRLRYVVEGERLRARAEASVE